MKPNKNNENYSLSPGNNRFNINLQNCEAVSARLDSESDPKARRQTEMNRISQKKF